MSRLVVDQNWESDDAPFSATGAMAISAVAPISGATSLRGGGGAAADGTNAYAIPAIDRPQSGGARGLLIQAHFIFRHVTLPSGGTCYLLKFSNDTGGGADVQLYTLQSGGVEKMRVDCSAGQVVTGATTIVADTTYTVDLEYREEREEPYIRVWLNEALEITMRAIAAVGFEKRLIDCKEIYMGVSAAGKCTWDTKWDEMKIWFGRDAS